LISSTSRTFVKIGPGRNSKSRVLGSKTDRPVTSVGWEIGSALDPGRRDAVDRAGDGAGEDGLRRDRYVLEQHVPAAHERRDDELDLLALAVDNGLDVVEQARGDVDRPREAFRVRRHLDVRLLRLHGARS